MTGENHIWTNDTIDADAKRHLWQCYRNKFTWAELNYMSKNALRQKKEYGKCKEDIHEAADVYPERY